MFDFGLKTLPFESSNALNKYHKVWLEYQDTKEHWKARDISHEKRHYIEQWFLRKLEKIEERICDHEIRKYQEWLRANLH